MRVFLLWLVAIATYAQTGGPDASIFAAIRRLESAERQNPADATVQTDLALNFFLLGQRDLFHAAIKRAMELDPGSAQAYYLAGRFALEAEHDPKSAIGAFEKALQLAPASFKARYYLGICLRQLARFDEAREAFRKAGEASTYSWPFRDLAEMELDLNRAQAALAPALRAVELEPQAAANLVIAGRAYQASGDPAKAIPLWEQAVRLDPLWEKPHFLLGNLYLARPETRAQGVKELELFRQLERQEHPSGASTMAAVPPAPQAKSRAEFDALGAVFAAQESLATVRAAENFLARFPDSELREQAMEVEFEAFRQRNDYAAARAVARGILAIHPENPAVLAGCALLIAEANDKAAFREAQDYAALAVRAANTTPRSERMSREEFRKWKNATIASAHAAEGLLALRRNDAAAALLSLDQAVKTRPVEDGSDYLRLGEAYAMKGDAVRAQEAFAHAEKLGPAVIAEAAKKQEALVESGAAAPAGDRFARARGFEKEGKLREAAGEYEAVIRVDPKLAEAYHNLGLVYYRLGDYARSAERLESALRIKPGLPGTPLFLGLAEFRLGRFEESMVNLRAALDAEPHNREGYLFLIRDQMALGRFRTELAGKALTEFPQDAELEYTVGLACLERIREIARTANEDGAESAAFLWLSLRRAEERQQAGVIEKYRKATAAMPEPALIREYDTLANLLKRSFDAVLARDADSAVAHSIRGYLHESRNEVEEALAEYRSAGDHFAAGRLLAQNVRLKEAEQELRAALAADPQNDRAKADLGRLYLQDDQAGRAREILQQVVSRYPRDAYAWADLGKAEGKLGAGPDAVRALRKALELDPSLNHVHYQLAMLYRQQGNEELAQQELEKFRRNRKSNP